jgi:hypothetical protein
MKRGSKKSFSFGFERSKYLEHFLDLRGVPFGRKDLRFLVSEGVQADGVPLTDIEIGKSGDEFFCILELACRGPETHGTTAVQYELASEVRFSLEFLEVIPVCPGEYSPIHPSRVFARRVFPVLGKLNA